jgi:hypothetical protein
MSILLVYPVVGLVVAVTVAIGLRATRPPGATRTGRPLLRTALFVVGMLIAAPILMLIGFAGVSKRL